MAETTMKAMDSRKLLIDALVTLAGGGEAVTPEAIAHRKNVIRPRAERAFDMLWSVVEDGLDPQFGGIDERMRAIENQIAIITGGTSPRGRPGEVVDAEFVEPLARISRDDRGAIVIGSRVVFLGTAEQATELLASVNVYAERWSERRGVQATIRTCCGHPYSKHDRHGCTEGTEENPCGCRVAYGSEMGPDLIVQFRPGGQPGWSFLHGDRLPPRMPEGGYRLAYSDDRKLAEALRSLAALKDAAHEADVRCWGPGCAGSPEERERVAARLRKLIGYPIPNVLGELENRLAKACKSMLDEREGRQRAETELVREEKARKRLAEIAEESIAARETAHTALAAAEADRDESVRKLGEAERRIEETVQARVSLVLSDIERGPAGTRPGPGAHPNAVRAHKITLRIRELTERVEAVALYRDRCVALVERIASAAGFEAEPGSKDSDEKLVEHVGDIYERGRRAGHAERDAHARAAVRGLDWNEMRELFAYAIGEESAEVGISPAHRNLIGSLRNRAESMREAIGVILYSRSTPAQEVVCGHGTGLDGDGPPCALSPGHESPCLPTKKRDPKCKTCGDGGRVPTSLYDAARVERGVKLEAPYGAPCPDCTAKPMPEVRGA